MRAIACTRQGWSFIAVVDPGEAFRLLMAAMTIIVAV